MNMKIDTIKHQSRSGRIISAQSFVVITGTRGKVLSRQTPAEFEATEHSAEVLNRYNQIKRHIVNHEAGE